MPIQRAQKIENLHLKENLQLEESLVQVDLDHPKVLDSKVLDREVVQVEVAVQALQAVLSREGEVEEHQEEAEEEEEKGREISNTFLFFSMQSL